jgi:Fe2+ transport system protein FeoA
MFVYPKFFDYIKKMKKIIFFKNKKNKKTKKSTTVSSMTETLDTIKPGYVCKVVSIGGNNILKNRLLCMGVTPSTLIEVVKVAPLGDPMAIKIRRYTLLIRKAEASGIVVEAVQLKNSLQPPEQTSDISSSNTPALEPSSDPTLRGHA